MEAKNDSRLVALRAAFELLHAGTSAGDYDPLAMAAALSSWIDDGADTRVRAARIEAVRLVGRHRISTSMQNAARFVAEADRLARFLLEGPKRRSSSTPEAA